MTKLIEVNTERLTVMADFLETVPPEDFSLEEWVTRQPIQPWKFGPITLRSGCGFAGCAMGWAAHAEVFPGFVLNREDDPVYRGASGIHAIAKLFGISERMGWFLFDNDHYPKRTWGAEPADVAARIRKLVERVDRLRERKFPFMRTGNEVWNETSIEDALK